MTKDKVWNRTFAVSLVVIAIAIGAYVQSGAKPNDGYADNFEGMQFLLGVGVAVLTPAGWIPAAIIAWLAGKLFGSDEEAEGSASKPMPAASQGQGIQNSPARTRTRFDTFPGPGRWTHWNGDYWPKTGEILPEMAHAMRDQVYEEDEHDDTVLPPRDLVFRAFWSTSPGPTKVVIIGDDPYPYAGDADGLAFSASRATAPPPTLRRIFDELQRDIGGPLRTNVDLTDWAEQGVLLLNTSLTVEPSGIETVARASAERHARIWRPLIESTIDVINSYGMGVVYVLLGQRAQTFARLVGPRALVLSSAHPSPRALGGPTPLPPFEDSRPFSQANKFLASSGRATINWIG